MVFWGLLDSILGPVKHTLPHVRMYYTCKTNYLDSIVMIIKITIMFVHINGIMFVCPY